MIMTISKSTLKIFTRYYINIHIVLNEFYAWLNSMQTFEKRFVNIASEVCFNENVEFKKKKCLNASFPVQSIINLAEQKY